MDHMARNRMEDILASLRISDDTASTHDVPTPASEEDDNRMNPKVPNGFPETCDKADKGSRNCDTTSCCSKDKSSSLAWGSIGEDVMSNKSWGSPALGDEADDELRDACGVFGCVLAKQTEPEDVNVAQTIYLGLVALQHRGQESAGITTSEGLGAVKHNYHKGQGLVSAVFNDTALNKLKGVLGIGHTRYSTAGGRDPINTQPFMVHTRHGPLAVAHNGELINANALRKTVLDRGVGLSTLSDSELLTQMLSLPPPRGEKDGKPDWPARVKHLMEASPTAYSLALMHEDTIYGVRDPFGNRPLCIGKMMPVGANMNSNSSSHTNGHDTSECSDSESTSITNGHDTALTSQYSKAELESSRPLGWVVSSESCAFQSIGAVLVREVYPGEIVEISPNGIRSLGMVSRSSRPVIDQVYEEHSDQDHFNIHTPSPPAFCIFEYVYFARPDSIFEGQQVYQVRQRCGKQLALEAPIEADLISTVPESATPAALGFSIQSGIPYLEVLCKNRYVGRSFIQPDTRSRQLAVAKKFGVISHNLAGRRVVLVDDSIVRGTTIGPLVKLLKQAGAKEVHIRIASPPICHPCYMGINIPTRGELIANSVQADDLAAKVGADSLVYLSIDGLVKAVREGVATRAPSGHCTACLDGKYPVQLEW